MKTKLLILIPCLLGFSITAKSEEITSENGPQLKEFYTRFPKSDANKNGILTIDEMYDYLDKKIKNGASSEKKGKFISWIYLKEILEKSPESDLNKDGVLTKVELLEFVKRQKEQHANNQATVAEA